MALVRKFRRIEDEMIHPYPELRREDDLIQHIRMIAPFDKSDTLMHLAITGSAPVRAAVVEYTRDPHMLHIMEDPKFGSGPIRLLARDKLNNILREIGRGL